MPMVTPGLSRRTLLTGLAAAPVAGLAARLGATPALAKAPMRGPALARFRRVRIGKLEVTTLLDGTRTVDDPHTIFGIGQQPDAVQKLAADNFLPGKQFVNSFAPVVVNTGEALVLFDTGNGASGRPAVGNLGDSLAAAGFKPEDIDVVVITHCHPDHIGGLMEGGKPLCPNARYAVGEAEYAFWSAPERASGPTERAAKLVQTNVVPLAEKLSFLKAESEVVPGIRALETFGHTPGHLSFHVESEGQRLLIWGDVANHFVLSLQRPGWHVRFDMDKEMGAATRKRVLDMAATDRIAVTGYHMPFPAVGFIEKAGEGFRWTPATYQLDL